MSVILDWMYGHDVHTSLLVEDVGLLDDTLLLVAAWYIDAVQLFL